jgi:hypothetical protein
MDEDAMNQEIAAHCDYLGMLASTFDGEVRERLTEISNFLLAVRQNRHDLLLLLRDQRAPLAIAWWARDAR